MLFFGGLTAILCVFALGLLWPHGRAIHLGPALWGYFVKSLYLSWIWFLVSYFSDIGNIARIVAVSLSVVIALQLIFRRIPNAYSIKTPPRKSYLRTFSVAALFLVIAYPALESFGGIFSTWDAVVSWNRWGTELAVNEYNPLSGAYPILWPALWSLIYEAQGTATIWFVSKATIAAPLIFMAIFATDFIRGPHAIAGFLLAALVALCFSTQSEVSVSGYMDIPLSLLGLGCLLLSISAVDEVNLDARKQLFQLAILTTAVAMVTKQGGIMFFAAIAPILVYETTRKRLNTHDLLNWGFLLVFPVLTFLYIYSSGTSGVLGNLDYLQELADKRRGDANVYIYAWRLFDDALPAVTLPLLGLGVIFNFIFYRSYRNILGILFFAVGIVTFVIFANCCSYGVRNGYLSLSFFIASAFAGFYSLEQWAGHAVPKFFLLRSNNRDINLKARISSALVVSLIALIFVSFEWSEERLAEADIELKFADIGFPRANALILRNSEKIEKRDVFASNYAIARYLPITMDRFLLCKRTDLSCVHRAKTQSNSALFLSFNSLENEESRQFIDEALRGKTATIIDKNGPFTLYEFK